jgi:hypothetical protein
MDEKEIRYRKQDPGTTGPETASIPSKNGMLIPVTSTKSRKMHDPDCVTLFDSRLLGSRELFAAMISDCADELIDSPSKITEQFLLTVPPV